MTASSFSLGRPAETESVLLLVVAHREPVLPKQHAVLHKHPLEDRHWWRNRWYSSAVQKPITRSTPARLYHERSNRTISPAAGNCEM